MTNKKEFVRNDKENRKIYISTNAIKTSTMILENDAVYKFDFRFSIILGFV